MINIFLLCVCVFQFISTQSNSTIKILIIHTSIYLFKGESQWLPYLLPSFHSTRKYYGGHCKKNVCNTLTQLPTLRTEVTNGVGWGSVHQYYHGKNVSCVTNCFLTGKTQKLTTDQSTENNSEACSFTNKTSTSYSLPKAQGVSKKERKNQRFGETGAEQYFSIHDRTTACMNRLHPRLPAGNVHGIKTSSVKKGGA